MLKFLFVVLLLANASLLAYQQGYLEPWLPSGREPARINNQFNAEKIRLIPANAVPAARLAAPPPPVAEKKPVALACAEIGNFTIEDAQRFEARLAGVAPNIRMSQRTVQETASYMVYIASLGSKAGADKKAEELRRIGVNDFYVIQDGSDLRWGISLGIFRFEDAANTHLGNLQQKGVRNARIGERPVPIKAVAFQVRELDASGKEAVSKVSADFPRQQIRECNAA